MRTNLTMFGLSKSVLDLGTVAVFLWESLAWSH